MSERKHICGCGRGNNPASRANLTGPAVDTFVWHFENGKWSKVAGPMTFGRAYAKARKLGDNYIAAGIPTLHGDKQ